MLKHHFKDPFMEMSYSRQQYLYHPCPFQSGVFFKTPAVWAPDLSQQGILLPSDMHTLSLLNVATFLLTESRTLQKVQAEWSSSVWAVVVFLLLRSVRSTLSLGSTVSGNKNQVDRVALTHTYCKLMTKQRQNRPKFRVFYAKWYTGFREVHHRWLNGYALTIQSPLLDSRDMANWTTYKIKL